MIVTRNGRKIDLDQSKSVIASDPLIPDYMEGFTFDKIKRIKSIVREETDRK